LRALPKSEVPPHSSSSGAASPLAEAEPRPPPAPARLFRWRRLPDSLLRLAAFFCLPLAAGATENGATAFPNGVEDFLVAGMPPPGWYSTTYFNRYSADSLVDNTGDMALESFRFRVIALTPRIDWVRPVSLLGADRWGTLFLVPWLDLDLALSPAPGVVVRGTNRGFGDLTMGNGLHWSFRKFEMINAVDVGFPTGAYNASELVNPGLNHWVVRLNTMGTWRPGPDWEVSYRLHTDFNFRNPATDYVSGETVYLNWAAGWKPAPPLTLGVAGYFLRQITDDRQAGQVVGPDGNRVRVAGMGPCIKYILPNHIILTGKYFSEFDVRNHPRGDQLWFYIIVPLGPPSNSHP
jgi:hypothetical protein